MSCVLRASGVHFDVDAFLTKSSLEPCKVFRRGEPKYPLSNPQGRKCSDSGFNVCSSDADFSELELQIEDTLSFLQQNGNELSRLVNYPGVERVVVDFGIEERNVAAQSESFPPSLLALAGKLGIWLSFTMYSPGVGPEAETPTVKS